VAATSSGVAAVKAAQRAVVRAQGRLDSAISAQDTAVTQLQQSCAASPDAKPITSSATPDGNDTISGSAGSQAVVVTLLTSGGSTVGSQRVDAEGTYSFSGLTAGDTYTVEITRAAAIDSTTCESAVGTVSDRQATLDDRQSDLDSAVTQLTQAVSQLSSGPTSSPTSQPSGSPSSQPSGSPTNEPSESPTSLPSASPSGQPSGQPSGSSTAQPSSYPSSAQSSGAPTAAPSSGSASSSGAQTSPSTGTTVTAAQIAADAKSVDSARADVTVARHDVDFATLTSPIAGKVAAVDLAAGGTVSSSSTSQTISVLGPGSMSVDLTIGLDDIDLVKVGQRAEVSVDGRDTPVAAHVTYVGSLNTSSSTGSSSTYSVTVRLDHQNASLLDGMGASVAIDVGRVRDAVTVPLSALHTTGTTTTVDVWDGGSVTSARVVLGVEGADRAAVTSGLRTGQKVVLANLDEAVPSSDDDTTGGGLSGLTGGGLSRGLSGGGFSGGGLTGGGPPGGSSGG
ncbi:MAG: HlyD family efflux transporter periplasmic adaptor subunit, partial [Williamsia herbipolensis]|nr:HlyD family efflux transporter periplasmic adaptor subunit [Williamsia herbipolensis]